MTDRICLIQQDITSLDVDAIVNAATNDLLGGGGVDGAIHRAAGSQLLEACRKLNGCKTGEAKITEGFRLKAKYIIHTVGPIYRGGNSQEHELLASAYLNSLSIASEYNCRSIAFPNISTGVYHYPKQEAAQLAIQTVADFLKKNKLPEKVFFVCFDEENYRIYLELLK